MKLFLLLFMLLGGHYDDPDEVFEYVTPNNADTLYIDGYSFIELRHRYKPQVNPAFMVIAMKDTTILYKVADEAKVWLYNFNPDTSHLAKPIYAKDIDGDGIKEMIYHCSSWGTGQFHDILIYTLEDNPRLKDTISNAGSNWLIDLDGDSIPEYIFEYDLYSGFFDKTYQHGTFGWFLFAKSVKKWDGHHYRDADKKFEKYIQQYCFNTYTYKDSNGSPLYENDTLYMNRVFDLGRVLVHSENGIPKVNGDSLFLSHFYEYPPPAFTKLIIYLYMFGYIAEADSLIKTCWKPDTNDIRNYLNLFQGYRDSSHIKWLKETDW
jgi:hypothetical protein